MLNPERKLLNMHAGSACLAMLNEERSEFINLDLGGDPHTAVQFPISQ